MFHREVNLMLFVLLAFTAIQFVGSSSQEDYDYTVDDDESDDSDENNSEQDESDDQYSYEYEEEPVAQKVECGKPLIPPSVDTRIVGGTDCKPNSWPWQVSLQKLGSAGYYHTCGGSIIKCRWVITAAHCVYRESAEDFLVILGEFDRSKDEGYEVQVKVRSIIVHENYIGQANYWHDDLALIELESCVTFNKYISPVCLPKNDSTKDIYNCYSTGWGRDATDGKPLARLNQVTMNYYPFKQCSQASWYGNMITTNMLCCGNAEGGKGTCQGDSGGPFVCRGHEFQCWTLYGLVSWAKGGCASAKHPTIFTFTGRYIDWIESYVYDY